MFKIEERTAEVVKAVSMLALVGVVVSAVVGTIAPIV